ncbi:MAG TPA: AI-2E family transporter [Bryobacteraceae bacterium]
MALLVSPHPSQKTTSIATSLIAAASTVALLYYGRDFFVTLIVSAIFACILDPIVVLVMKLRIPRPAATAIVIGLALIAVYLLSVVVWTQIATIREDLPTYSSRVIEIGNKVNDTLGDLEKKTVEMVVPKALQQQEQQIQKKPQEALKARRRRAGLPPAPVVPPKPEIQEVRIHTDPKPPIATIYSYVSGYFHVLVMASFVPFLVYFMLSWRDYIGQAVLRLFHDEGRYMAGRSWDSIGNSTRAYVLGNFFLWVSLSVFSGIVFFFMGVPYWLIVAPLSALLSLVPYVGLPLSVIPPGLAALAIPNKFKVVLFVILITAALHVFAMNFLYPKIIGRRVHLNPFVVTVALMFWGLLWGGVGLILAVPITAGVKALCDNVEPLHGYGRILGDR